MQQTSDRSRNTQRHWKAKIRNWKRCYKKAFSHEKAIQMILNGECGQFNPVLFQCLTDIQEELEEELKVDFH